jgi:hypothetical protein
LAFIALVVLAAAGSGDVVGGATTRSAEQLRASCGEIEFGSVPADWLAFPPLGELVDEIDGRRGGA